MDQVFQDESRPPLFINLDDTASDIEETFTGGSRKLANFNFLEPAGFYELDLSTAEEYALACEILRVANSRSGSQLNKVSYKKPGAKTFSKMKLRREDYGKRDALMGRPVQIVLAENGQPAGRLYGYFDGECKTWPVTQPIPSFSEFSKF